MYNINTQNLSVSLLTINYNTVGQQSGVTKLTKTVLPQNIYILFMNKHK